MDSTYVLPLARVIRDAIRGLKELRKMSRRTQTLFATDLAMIGLGVRTGYLVDVVTVPNATETFSNLIQHLRKNSGQEYPAFATVVHLYEPTTSQSFFVNIRLLFDVRDPGATDGCAICQQTSFVSIGPNDQMSLLSSPERGVSSVLRCLKDKLQPIGTMPSSISLPCDLTQQSTVPLAGFLLEYPVAYVPASPDMTMFLGGVPLDVYECVVRFGTPSGLLERHTLLKFSVPSQLATTHPGQLGPSVLTARLVERFSSRVHELSADAVLNVVHTCETFDRVAL